MTTKEVARGRPQRRTSDAAPAGLSSLSARIRDLQQESRTLEEERNRLVKRAIAKGWTHAQIAEATGLTRGRIGQIATSRLGHVRNRQSSATGES